ncbi:polyprenyl synthetase family protein [Campylobacter geochelonis]|uniref:polyprenyl synthetase family protein n=1 Tax=Campylobacter geochelonis TaxID=1780362 RepID=UPI0007707226|nr:polyprenyl synthetase family protein [Campylobacter geochelonis]CZE49736.1 geranyltranstransferase [Campylobacter geochelonis]
MNLLDEFKLFLKNNTIECESYHPYFQEALNYMLLSGGKHFRAQLLLGTVKALNPSLLENAMRVALAVEMVHTYSLIHDDLPVMDDADLRRGHTTTHVKYDEATALLVGDALNTQAFYEISTSNLDDKIKTKCTQILAYNAGANGMVLGQALDLYFENKRLNLDELKFLHLHKTGALIAASLQLGAVIAGFSDEDSKKLYELGLSLGLVFQIQDDIIDATKSCDEAGKPTHNDEAKNSFTNLLGVEKSKEIKDKLIDEIQTKAKENEPKLTDMIENLINRYLKE